MAKDMEKRRRVMERSMQLGHCVCNPKKSCPCDIFRDQDVCPCAGERPDMEPGLVRLTEWVENPGCASKIDQGTLRRVLKNLPTFDDPRVLVGIPAGDDAGVYQLDDETALVQTVDVFTPSVDDPYAFGQIAAANSLSDVYAMGGRPITALSIVGFPVRELPDEILQDILRGGIDKMVEAGVPVIGGHSINESEIKAGFAVTGLVDPRRMATNAAAQPGDRLVLTKPLGTGVIAFANQIGRVPQGSMEAAARSMAALNRRAAELMVQFHSHACTDITGFGLMGHLASLAAASGTDVEIVWDDLPLLPGVLECAADGIFSGAVERNREASASAMHPDAGLLANMLDLCFDPQTSGGLLIAAPPAGALALLASLHNEGIAEAAIVGRVLGPGRGKVFVRHSGRRVFPVGSPKRKTQQPAAASSYPTQETEKENDMGGCCEAHGAAPREPNESSGGESVVAAAQKKFQEFIQAATAPGALDARTKQAISVALSVLARCEPCIKHHVKKAEQMGLSAAEIDEAAWMAIAFGGSPVMAFYNAARKAT